MQLLGIGTDIENIDRFPPDLIKQKANFLKKIFTAKELRYCFSKKPAAPHLAARYAGKEAVIKALTSAGIQKISYREIEINLDAKNVPRVKIKKLKNLDIGISLSHCRDKAIAVALVSKTPS